MSNNLLPSQPICYSGLERVSLSRLTNYCADFPMTDRKEA